MQVIARSFCVLCEREFAPEDESTCPCLAPDPDTAADVDRLQAFADDPSKPAAKRAEARAVIDLHRRFMLDLGRRSRLTVVVEPLGMLLRVPDEPDP